MAETTAPRSCACLLVIEATFIGHQGWLLSDGTTTIAIDPILTEGFGHGGLAGAVYPPRQIDLDAFPAIDAIVITHEHDDHFDIPTLALIDRRTPVYVSARSSVALRGFIEDWGFEVRLLEAGRSHAIGGLSYRTFVADHRATPHADEWDVMPYIVSDAGGQGAFASSVDVRMPSTMIDALRTTPGWPGLLGLANNVTDTRFTRRGQGTIEPREDTETLARVLARRMQGLADVAGAPAATLICGAGWSHGPSWIDNVAFVADSERLAESLQARCGSSFSAPRPGDCFRVERQQVHTQRCDFVTCRPRSAWPDRSLRPTAQGPLREAACGRSTVSESELDELEAQLQPFARFLCGRSTFLGLHSLAPADGTQPTVAFVLARGDAAPAVFAYRPEAGNFERVVSAEPFAEFVGGYECWAADLLALLRGTIGPSALCYTGRMRCWSHRPDLLDVTPHALWQFGHPLQRPEVARRLYDHLARDLGGCRPRIGPPDTMRR